MSRKLLLQNANVSMLIFIFRKTYDLQEFVDEQKHALDDAIERLNKFRSHVIFLVENVCTVG